MDDYFADLEKLLVLVYDFVAILFPASGFLLVIGCLSDYLFLKEFHAFGGDCFLVIASCQ
jgi:hypothetical protein